MPASNLFAILYCASGVLFTRTPSVIQVRGVSDPYLSMYRSTTVRQRSLKQQSAVAELVAFSLLYPYEGDNEPFSMANVFQYKLSNREAGGSSSVRGNKVKLYELSWA